MNNNDLKRNKTKRGIIRTAITKLINKISDEIKKENADLEIIQESLAVLLERENELCTINETIETLTDLKDLEAEIENVLECSDAIVLCKSRANRFAGK